MKVQQAINQLLAVKTSSLKMVTRLCMWFTKQWLCKIFFYNLPLPLLAVLELMILAQSARNTQRNINTVFVPWNRIFRNLLDAHTEMHLFHYYKSEQFAFEKSRHMQISLSTHLRFFFGSLNWRSPGGWRFTLMWSRVGRRTITCRGSTDSRSGTGRYRIIVSSGVRRSRRLQWF